MILGLAAQLAPATGYLARNLIANGQVVSTPAPLAVPATVEIGGIPAAVQFAGLAFTGEYQINVVAPANVPDGDNTLTVTVGGYTSPGGVFVNVAK